MGGLGKPCAGEGGPDQVHWGVSILFCPVDRILDPETPGLRSLTQVQPRRYKHPLPGVCLGTLWRKSATHTQSWCVSHPSSALPQHRALNNARKISPPPIATSVFLSHGFHHPMYCHCVLTCFIRSELLEPRSMSPGSSVCLQPVQPPAHRSLSLNVLCLRE